MAELSNAAIQPSEPKLAMEEVGSTTIALGAVQDVPSHLFQPLLDNDLNVGSDGLICWA